MNGNAISRRTLLGLGTVVGASALLPATRAQADSGTREKMVRTYYSAWESKNWTIVDGLLADAFTFTSPFDDHIGKSVFHDRCWGQAAHIQHFDLESVAVAGDAEAFVKYLCHNLQGTSFRNTEFFRFAGERIIAIECYFGGNAGFPTAAECGKR